MPIGSFESDASFSIVSFCSVFPSYVVYFPIAYQNYRPSNDLSHGVNFQNANLSDCYHPAQFAILVVDSVNATLLFFFLWIKN